MTDKQKVGNEWRTTDELVDRSLLALGTNCFTLDPAAPTSGPDNVPAKLKYTELSNGLVQPWEAETLWMNPPFNPVKPWLRRLSEGWKSGEVRAGLALFGDRALCGEGGALILNAAKVLIVPARRIRFVNPFTGELDTAPSFGSVLVAGGDDLDLLRVRWAFADDGYATLWYTR